MGGSAPKARRRRHGPVKFRLFPSREVAALIDLVEVNEVVKSCSRSPSRSFRVSSIEHRRRGPGAVSLSGHRVLAMRLRRSASALAEAW
jgi:hypothetical protein